MKIWTVVIEVHDDTEVPCTKEQIESAIVNPYLPASMAYQIFETVEAPYGPQPGNDTYTILGTLKFKGR